MLPSRGGAGTSRGATASRKPRGASRGRGAFKSRAGGAHKADTNGSDAEESSKGPSGPGSKKKALRPTADNFAPTASPVSGDHNARYQALKKAREQERKQAISDGFLADPDHPRSLAHAITPVGTCPDMCAEFERLERIVQGDVWSIERLEDRSGPDEHRMVKKFRRAAAGMEEQLPSDLRPPQVLKKTVDFLFDNVLRNASALENVHYFIWDRTRAIRNDFSIQQVSKPEDLTIAIECYERIARFHMLSLHQLGGLEKPYDNYDHQQEREQLDKTLLSLLQYYDDNRGKVPLPNEAEFRSYSIIFQIQTSAPDLEDRTQTWPKRLLHHDRIQRALRLYALACNASEPQGPFRRQATAHPIAQANWAGFWALIKSSQISYLMACVAEIYFPYIRRLALNAILSAYKHGGKDKTGKPMPNEDWSLEDLELVLGLDSEDAVEDLLSSVDLDVGTRADGVRFFDLNTAGGTISMPPVLPLSDIVEQKRHGRAFCAVVNGMSVSAARRAGLVDRSDDDDSLFIPEHGAPPPAFQPPRTTFSDTPLNDASSKGPVFGSPSASPFANPATKNASGEKRVHFGDDTKPSSGEKPAAQLQSSLFPNQPPTTSPFATFGAPQAGNPFQPATLFPPQPSEPSLTEDSAATNQATEDAERERREAEERRQKEAQEQARREQAAREQAALEQRQAEERAARENEERLKAAREKALQEKIAREREIARREAEARQAAERQRQEQERIARDKEREAAQALDLVAQQIAFADGGLLDQYVEFRLGAMIQKAKAQVQQERATAAADWFREGVLRHRYGRLWREICVKRRLQRRGIERRKRAKLDAQRRAEHSKATSIAAELDEFRRRGEHSRELSVSVDGSLASNKENDPSRASQVPLQPERRPRQVSRHDEPSTSQRSSTSRLSESLIFNPIDSSMPPPSLPREHEDYPISFRSSYSDSRASSLNRSVGDLASVRSTYLPHSSRAADESSPGYGQRYGTTKSSYFQLRAMGLDPNSSTLYPERPAPQSERKRSRISDFDSTDLVPRKRAQTLSGSRSPLLRSRSPPGPVRSDAVESIEAPADGDAVQVDDEDDDSDPVLAMARRARVAMQEGSSLFREASRMLSATPDRGRQTLNSHDSHLRHQSQSRISLNGDSGLQLASSRNSFESPRRSNPAVSRFLHRVSKDQRRQYADEAAAELAQEEARDAARRKARRDREAQEAEAAIEQARQDMQLGASGHGRNQGTTQEPTVSLDTSKSQNAATDAILGSSAPLSSNTKPIPSAQRLFQPKQKMGQPQTGPAHGNSFAAFTANNDSHAVSRPLRKPNQPRQQRVERGNMFAALMADDDGQESDESMPDDDDEQQYHSEIEDGDDETLADADDLASSSQDLDDDDDDSQDENGDEQHAPSRAPARPWPVANAPGPQQKGGTSVDDAIEL